MVDNSVDSPLGEALLLTHLQQIRSQIFLSRVALSFTPAERSTLLALYPIRSAIRALPAADTAQVVKDRLVDLLSKNLRADHTPPALLAARHRDGALAQLLANGLADQCIRYIMDRSSA